MRTSPADTQSGELLQRHDFNSVGQALTECIAVILLVALAALMAFKTFGEDVRCRYSYAVSEISPGDEIPEHCANEDDDYGDDGSTSTIPPTTTSVPPPTTTTIAPPPTTTTVPSTTTTIASTTTTSIAPCLPTGTLTHRAAVGCWAWYEMFGRCCNAGAWPSRTYYRYGYCATTDSYDTFRTTDYFCN